MVRGLVSLMIREALSLGSLESQRRTFSILHLSRIPLEIPFREIAVKMGLAH
jgi:hypothetical protein